MTGREWLRQATARLSESGNPDARVDANWFLQDASCAIRESEYRAFVESELSESDMGTLERWLSRREAGEPLQYILGYTVFMGLRIGVDPRVLIPRQDTETLCEQALKRVTPGSKVLDLCTGSGALAVAIKKRCPGAAVSAADISADALTVARRNAQSHGLDIEFIQCDLFGRMQGREFDLIACNPPYLSDSDMDRLQAEVRREPELALRGGPDGLDFYRRIAREAPPHLSRSGSILLEVGIGQARAVADLFMGETQIVNDINAIERVVIWTKKG